MMAIGVEIFQSAMLKVVHNKLCYGSIMCLLLHITSTP